MTATSLVAVFREQVDLRRIFLDDPARHEKGQPQLRGALPRSPAVCSRLTLEGGGFELVWGLPCQVVFFGLLPVLCSMIARVDCGG